MLFLLEFIWFTYVNAGTNIQKQSDEQHGDEPPKPTYAARFCRAGTEFFLYEIVVIKFLVRQAEIAGKMCIRDSYMRFREGIAGDKGKCSVNLSGGGDMIFDHCSIEWGRWDCLGLTGGSHDMTFQNCIIGEGVDPQRFGSLSDDANNITYSHNLWICLLYTSRCV